jgi:hypothetical protein
MLPALSLFLLTAAAPPEQGHLQINPLYRELVETGVAVSAKDRLRLRAPTMPDGLDKDAQMKIIQNLAGDTPVEELLRKSVVAKHVFNIRDNIKPSDPQAPAYGVDIWFVAYGDLGALAKKDVNALFSSDRKDMKGKALTTDELKERGITLGAKPDLKERYVYTSYPMLEKVQLGMTTYSVISQTPESLVLASNLDPRFLKDKQFPNQWQKITNDGGGNVYGPPHPYDCTATYLKITRLHAPKGALFVEVHRVATEPKQWFNGANLLRSKLPIPIQSEVRAFRREAVKTIPGN